MAILEETRRNSWRQEMYLLLIHNTLEGSIGVKQESFGSFAQLEWRAYSSTPFTREPSAAFFGKLAILGSLNDWLLLPKINSCTFLLLYLNHFLCNGFVCTKSCVWKIIIYEGLLLCQVWLCLFSSKCHCKRSLYLRVNCTTT